MKDYVFIGWNNDYKLAIEVKKLLDKDGFTCVVGGDYEENPEHLRIKSTINETISHQMLHCDQAILLFEKKKGEKSDILRLSENLIYELGFLSALYTFYASSAHNIYASSLPQRHIFRIDIDEALFPTDLRGVWACPITTGSKKLEEVAEEIAGEFKRRQKHIPVKNKFTTLSNSHIVEEKLKNHFVAPTMSDCDLAMDILVYTQSAFCFQEQVDVRQKLEFFRIKYDEYAYDSPDLLLALDYAHTTMELFCSTGYDGPVGESVMQETFFRRLLGDYENVCRTVNERIGSPWKCAPSRMALNNGIIDNYYFDSWVLSQTQEHICYLILVYLTGNTLSAKKKTGLARLGIQYAKMCIRNLKLLAEKNSDKMYAYLLLAYAHKNVFSFYEKIGEKEKGLESQAQSFYLRKKLNDHVRRNATIKPSLKQYIANEYLLQAIEELNKEWEKESPNTDLIDQYIFEIEEYKNARESIERNKDILFAELKKSYSSVLEKFNAKK